MLENPLKKFPKLKDDEINVALSEYDKVADGADTEGGKENGEREKEREGRPRGNINLTASPERWVCVNTAASPWL